MVRCLAEWDRLLLMAWHAGAVSDIAPPLDDGPADRLAGNYLSMNGKEALVRLSYDKRTTCDEDGEADRKRP
jgi:hypothetical protein